MTDAALIPPWRTVFELASRGISENWTLVGGLMVELHARHAGVFMPRPTNDVDMLVDYAAHRSSLTEAQTGLHEIGFELSGDEQHAYRFKHPDGRKLDLMVADHLPSQLEPRLNRRPAFAAPAGEQAIRRRDRYQLTFADGGIVRFGAPDELGALVAKGAAWLVDRRDRERHLDDGAVLFACVSDASAIDYPSMSKNDRNRIRALIEQLHDDTHPSWMRLNRTDREKGLINLLLIRQTISLN